MQPSDVSIKNDLRITCVVYGNSGYLKFAFENFHAMAFVHP